MKWAIVLDPFDGPSNVDVVGPFDSEEDALKVAEHLYHSANVGTVVVPLYPAPVIAR